MGVATAEARVEARVAVQAAATARMSTGAVSARRRPATAVCEVEASAMAQRRFYTEAEPGSTATIGR
eukprot:7382781-Prymnesium_polylepis.1